MKSRLQRSKSNLEEVLHIMVTEEKNRNYKKAQKLKKEADQIKREIQTIQNKTENYRHKRQKTQMIQILDGQSKNFKERWDEIIKQAKDEGDKAVSELSSKHEEQCGKLKGDQQEYHDSGAVIFLQKKQQNLGKQGCFMEAHAIQKERYKLQAQEKQLFQKMKSNKRKTQMKQLRIQQYNEKQFLKNKNEIKMDQLKVERQKQDKIIAQKHLNIKRQFIAEQEKESLVKSGQLKNTIFTSRVTSPNNKLRERATFLSAKKLPDFSFK